jgi:hypothetical protein
MRERVRPRNARAPCASSFLKPTRSSAISTASRSLDAPSDARASSRSCGSSQNALRTFPLLVARAPDVVMCRGERGRVEDRWRRDDVGTRPPLRTQQDTISCVRRGVGHASRSCRASPCCRTRAPCCWRRRYCPSVLPMLMSGYPPIASRTDGPDGASALIWCQLMGAA